MRTILAACETIEDEIKATLNRLELTYPVVWLHGGLHTSIERLRARLQEIFLEVDGQCDLLLVSLGYCGGGVSGLSTGDYTTVLPLADDCLSLLLGSMSARKESARVPTYYLTAGWMRHENNVITGYDQMVAKFGTAKADRMNSLVLKHYRRFGLVDTGVYDLEAAMDRVAPMAEKLNLSVEKLSGDGSWLDRLLTGPHEADDFLVIPPRGRLDFEQWKDLLMGGGAATPGG